MENILRLTTNYNIPTGLIQSTFCGRVNCSWKCDIIRYAPHLRSCLWPVIIGLGAWGLKKIVARLAIFRLSAGLAQRLYVLLHISGTQYCGTQSESFINTNIGIIIHLGFNSVFLTQNLNNTNSLTYCLLHINVCIRSLDFAYCRLINIFSNLSPSLITAFWHCRWRHHAFRSQNIWSS